jgi:hypothetical protein
MLAAKEGSRLLKAVPDNASAAMRARRGQRLDRAFEAVKGVGLTAVNYLKGLVVIVPAGFADCHDIASRSSPPRVQAVAAKLVPILNHYQAHACLCSSKLGSLRSY